VNYWRDKPAGEEFTHILPQEDLFLKKTFEFTQNADLSLHSVIQESLIHHLPDDHSNAMTLFPSSHTPIHISLDRDFKDDLWYWQQQIIPPFYQQLILNRSHLMNSSRTRNNISMIPSSCEAIALPFHPSKTHSQSYLNGLLQFQKEICLQKDHVTRSSQDPSHSAAAPAAAFVFHLPKSSILELVNRHYLNYTLGNWMSWILKETSQKNSKNEIAYDIEILPTALREDTRKWKESMPGGWQESRTEELE
jgi:hypothetical protein